jgi:hypothetical protein
MTSKFDLHFTKSRLLFFDTENWFFGDVDDAWNRLVEQPEYISR